MKQRVKHACHMSSMLYFIKEVLLDKIGVISSPVLRRALLYQVLAPQKTESGPNFTLHSVEDAMDAKIACIVWCWRDGSSRRIISAIFAGWTNLK
jgi:hypothetical protein